MLAWLLPSRRATVPTSPLPTGNCSFAQAAHPGALTSLTQMVKVSQILFGTDFPYRTSKEIGKGLVDFGFNAAELAAINHDNAAKLFPRFA